MISPYMADTLARNQPFLQGHIGYAREWGNDAGPMKIDEMNAGNMRLRGCY